MRRVAIIFALLTSLLVWRCDCVDFFGISKEKSYAITSEIPSNQIWYICKLGATISPYAYDEDIVALFGANIVSNTYENGIGVITFDGVVTKIGSSAFKGDWLLQSIALPDSVEVIESSAFKNCLNLKSITIGSGVKKIVGYGESGAFSSCSIEEVHIRDIDRWTQIEFGDQPMINGANLYLNGELVTDYTFPEGRTSIGDFVFCGCKSLQRITIPESIASVGYMPFIGCTNLSEFCGKYASVDRRCLVIDGVVVAYAEGGNGVYTLPEGVTTIHFGAFRKSNIESLVIPNSVTTIQEHSFELCHKLRSISLGSGITTIEKYTFRNCKGLKTIVIPNNITSIGDSAFAECDGLESVTLSNKLTQIGWHAFQLCKNLRTIDFPASITTIDSSAFESSGLERVVIPDNITTIKSNAFCQCYNLRSVTIGKGLTEIGTSLFESCTSLESITIPENIATIGAYAFQGCSALKSITLPHTVDRIMRNAFCDCLSLEAVFCERAIPPTAVMQGDFWHAFDNNAPSRHLVVPKHAAYAYERAEGWSRYANCILERNQ